MPPLILAKHTIFIIRTVLVYKLLAPVAMEKMRQNALSSKNHYIFTVFLRVRHLFCIYVILCPFYAPDEKALDKIPRLY